MDDQFSIIILMAFLVSASISIWMYSYFKIKAKKSSLFNSFIILQLLQLAWLVTKLLRIISPTDGISWVFTVLQYLCICFLGAAYISFAYRFYKGSKLNLVIRYIIFSISFINFFIVLINPWYHLFFKSINMLGYTRGPVFYFHTIFSYALITIGMYYMFVGISRKVLAHIGPIRIIYYIALGIPLLYNVLEVSNLMPTRYDLTPITFNFTYLLFGYLAYKYQFLDVSSLARYKIYQHMQEGIIVFDHNLQVESINNIVYKTIPNTISLYENMTLDKYLDTISQVIVDADALRIDLLDFLKSSRVEMETELGLIKNNTVRYYLLDIKKADFGKGKVIIRIIGIDRYKQAIEKLKDQNMTLQSIHNSLSEELSVRKKLALAKERNRISKEVHDILGYSLTVVISLVEASKMVLYSEKDMAREKLEIALKTSRHNLNNLKKTLSNPNNKEMKSDQLVDDIRTMASSLEKAGTIVDLITRGHEMPMPSQYYDAIYHICQEGLTNAIRHGQAKSITIALRFDEYQVDILIVDNGLGANYFEKGNGLKHMEKRVLELGGYFSCGSPDGEGFSIHTNLPIY